MVKIPEFGIMVSPDSPRGQMPSTGEAEFFTQLASTASHFAGRIGDMADAAAKREGMQAGLAAGSASVMPSISYAIGDGETAGYLDRAMAAESGGNPNAKNPNSTATGAFQFTEGTWLDVLDRNRPDLAAGKSRDALLAMRNDPALSRELAGALSRENGAVLKSKGIGVSSTSLYLAHFLGAGGASSLLSAGADTPVSAVLGADQISANKSVLEGKSVGDVIAWAGGKMGDAAPTVTATVNGSIGKLDLTGAMTLRGAAFDGAALDIYRQRADSSLRAGMAAVALNNPGQPAALSGALEAFVAGQLDDVPEVIRGDLMASAERQKLGLVSEAATTWRRELATQNAAVFQDSLAGKGTDLTRLAMSLPFDAQGDAALAAELDSFDRFVANSPLSPSEQGELRRSMRGDLMSARVLGGFNNQTDAAGRARYAAEFGEAWKKGGDNVAGIDGAGYNRIAGTMASQIGADATEMTRQGAALTKQFDGLFDRMEKGWSIGADELAGLNAQALLVGDPAVAARADMVTRMAGWQAANRQARPAEISAQIDQLEADMVANGASDRGLQALDVMTGMKDKMTAELVRDPLGWADRAGVVKLTPLDFSSPETVVASLSARQAEAKAVAERYGQPERYFRPEEAARLTQLGATDPAFIPNFAMGLTTALGSDTPKALSEISDKAPLVAHVAGLVHSSGRTELLGEVGQVIALRGMKDYKPDLPKPNQIAAQAAAQIKGALGYLPQTQAAAIDVANALYEGRAYMRGLTATSFDKPDSPGVQLFNQTLNEALGGEVIAGVQYGGLMSVNGAATLVPPGVQADALPKAIANIAPQDLVTQMPIGSPNGVPVSAEQLRGAKLVVVGEGRYRLMLGDPRGFDPQPVVTPDGRLFELDIKALLKSQEVRGVAEQAKAISDAQRETDMLYTPLGGMFGGAQ